MVLIMNLPNKLTVVRVILVPVFMVFALIGGRACSAAALLVFAAASITDWLDGYIARRDKLVTDFGKFMDPLADKMLTTAAFLVLIYYDKIIFWVWMLMIVLAREFMVAGIRLVAAGSGKVVAASMWGKAKTVSQMAAIIIGLLLMIAFPESEAARIITSAAVWVSVVLTVISGVDYVIKNKDFVKET